MRDPKIQQIIDDMELSELFGDKPRQELKDVNDTKQPVSIHESDNMYTKPVVAEKATVDPHDWSEAVKAVFKLKKEKGL